MEMNTWVFLLAYLFLFTNTSEGGGKPRGLASDEYYEYYEDDNPHLNIHVPHRFKTYLENLLTSALENSTSGLQKGTGKPVNRSTVEGHLHPELSKHFSATNFTNKTTNYKNKNETTAANLPEPRSENEKETERSLTKLVHPFKRNKHFNTKANKLHISKIKEYNNPWLNNGGRLPLVTDKRNGESDFPVSNQLNSSSQPNSTQKHLIDSHFTESKLHVSSPPKQTPGSPGLTLDPKDLGSNPENISQLVHKDGQELSSPHETVKPFNIKYSNYEPAGIFAGSLSGDKDHNYYSPRNKSNTIDQPLTSRSHRLVPIQNVYPSWLMKKLGLDENKQVVMTGLYTTSEPGLTPELTKASSTHPIIKPLDPTNTNSVFTSNSADFKFNNEHQPENPDLKISLPNYASGLNLSLGTNESSSLRALTSSKEKGLSTYPNSDNAFKILPDGPVTTAKYSLNGLLNGPDVSGYTEPNLSNRKLKHMETFAFPKESKEPLSLGVPHQENGKSISTINKGDIDTSKTQIEIGQNEANSSNSRTGIDLPSQSVSSHTGTSMLSSQLENKPPLLLTSTNISDAGFETNRSSKPANVQHPKDGQREGPIDQPETSNLATSPPVMENISLNTHLRSNTLDTKPKSSLSGINDLTNATATTYLVDSKLITTDKYNISNTTNTSHPVEDLITHLIQDVSKKTIKKRKVRKLRRKRFKKNKESPSIFSNNVDDKRKRNVNNKMTTTPDNNNNLPTIFYNNDTRSDNVKLINNNVNNTHAIKESFKTQNSSSKNHHNNNSSTGSNDKINGSSSSGNSNDEIQINLQQKNNYSTTNNRNNTGMDDHNISNNNDDSIAVKFNSKLHENHNSTIDLYVNNTGTIEVKTAESNDKSTSKIPIIQEIKNSTIDYHNNDKGLEDRKSPNNDSNSISETQKGVQDKNKSLYNNNNNSRINDFKTTKSNENSTSKVPIIQETQNSTVNHYNNVNGLEDRKSPNNDSNSIAEPQQGLKDKNNSLYNNKNNSRINDFKTAKNNENSTSNVPTFQETQNSRKNYYKNVKGLEDRKSPTNDSNSIAEPQQGFQDKNNSLYNNNNNSRTNDFKTAKNNENSTSKVPIIQETQNSTVNHYNNVKGLEDRKSPNNYSNSNSETQKGFQDKNNALYNNNKSSRINDIKTAKNNENSTSKIPIIPETQNSTINHYNNDKALEDRKSPKKDGIAATPKGVQDERNSLTTTYINKNDTNVDYYVHLNSNNNNTKKYIELKYDSSQNLSSKSNGTDLAQGFSVINNSNNPKNALKENGSRNATKQMIPLKHKEESYIAEKSKNETNRGDTLNQAKPLNVQLLNNVKRNDSSENHQNLTYENNVYHENISMAISQNRSTDKQSSLKNELTHNTTDKLKVGFVYPGNAIKTTLNTALLNNLTVLERGQNKTNFTMESKGDIAKLINITETPYMATNLNNSDKNNVTGVNSTRTNLSNGTFFHNSSNEHILESIVKSDIPSEGKLFERVREDTVQKENLVYKEQSGINGSIVKDFTNSDKNITAISKTPDLTKEKQPHEEIRNHSSYRLKNNTSAPSPFHNIVTPSKTRDKEGYLNDKGQESIKNESAKRKEETQLKDKIKTQEPNQDNVTIVQKSIKDTELSKKKIETPETINNKINEVTSINKTNNHENVALNNTYKNQTFNNKAQSLIADLSKDKHMIPNLNEYEISLEQKNVNDKNNKNSTPNTTESVTVVILNNINYFNDLKKESDSKSDNNKTKEHSILDKQNINDSVKNIPKENQNQIVSHGKFKSKTVKRNETKNEMNEKKEKLPEIKETEAKTEQILDKKDNETEDELEKKDNDESNIESNDSDEITNGNKIKQIFKCKYTNLKNKKSSKKQKFKDNRAKEMKVKNNKDKKETSPSCENLETDNSDQLKEAPKKQIGKHESKNIKHESYHRIKRIHKIKKVTKSKTVTKEKEETQIETFM